MAQKDGKKGRKGSRKASAPDTTNEAVGLNMASLEVTAIPAAKTEKVELTPAERFAADIARRNQKGTLTTGQMTFLRNKAREVALAAKTLGLKASDATAILGRRHEMDDATLASLTTEAERVRNVEGRKTPYYAKKGYARFAFNEGAPALTWAQAEPIITETVHKVFDQTDA